MSYSIALAQLLISLVFLALLWFGPISRLIRDNYRTRIRTIRDGLFDFMVENGYDFNTPAYRATRQSLNGLIRLSNYISPLSFLYFLSVVAAEEKTKSSDTATDTVEELPDGKLKERLRAALHEATAEMLRFIFRRRISGWLLMGLLRVLVLLFKLFGQRKQPKCGDHSPLVDRPSHRLLAQAYRFGQPEPSIHAKTLLAN